MSGVYAPPCICPRDACFKVLRGAHCKHFGMVLADFVDRWGNRFSVYVHPAAYKVGTRAPSGARCISIRSPA